MPNGSFGEREAEDHEADDIQEHDQGELPVVGDDHDSTVDDQVHDLGNRVNDVP